MPVCSYVVIPREGAVAAVEARLLALPGCEVVRAENRDLLLLVTDTADAEQEQALTRTLESMDGIASMVLTFGELDGAAPVQGSRRWRGAAR
jgi:nitrate reductase NapAB chaperone NapD